MARYPGRYGRIILKDGYGESLADLPQPIEGKFEGTFTGTWEDSSLPDLSALVGPQNFTAYAAPDDPAPVAFKATLELEVSEDDDVSLAIKPDTVQDELAIWLWAIKMCEPFDHLVPVMPIGKHCVKCGETTMWSDTQALADKQERAGHKIERKIVEVICDKCLQKQQDN
jgi:hypothetical protein